MREPRGKRSANQCKIYTKEVFEIFNLVPLKG